MRLKALLYTLAVEMDKVHVVVGVSSGVLRSWLYESCALVPQINEVVLRSDDCCRVVPMLNQLGEEVTLCVARNPLATPTSSHKH